MNTSNPRNDLDELIEPLTESGLKTLRNKLNERYPIEVPPPETPRGKFRTLGVWLVIATAA